MPKVDLAFRLTGTEIPADHGYHLLAAIARVIPAVHSDDEIGVHPICGRLIGNRRLALTDRSRLTIRLDAERIGEVLSLAGKSLDLHGSVIHVRVPQVRALVPAARLYSRLVIIKGFLEPEPFLEAVRRQLEESEVTGEASLVPVAQRAATAPGGPAGTRSPFIRRTLRIRDKEVVGFAVRVQDLTAEESIRLQESGLGGRRRFGCGTMLPIQDEVSVP